MTDEVNELPVSIGVGSSTADTQIFVPDLMCVVGVATPSGKIRDAPRRMTLCSRRPASLWPSYRPADLLLVPHGARRGSTVANVSLRLNIEGAVLFLLEMGAAIVAATLTFWRGIFLVSGTTFVGSCWAWKAGTGCNRACVATFVHEQNLRELVRDHQPLVNGFVRRKLGAYSFRSARAIL